MSKNNSVQKGELDAAVDRFRSAYIEYRKGERKQADTRVLWARMATKKSR